MTNNFNKSSYVQNKPKLSKEEFAKFKQEEKEKIYKLIDETAVEIINDSEKFKAFLDTQTQMDRYSQTNALLIFNQFPQASKLKDFADWSKENVKIKKGAKSISILEPIEYAKKDGSTGISYNVKKVFDVSQTNSEKQPATNINYDPKALIVAMLDACAVRVLSVEELPYTNMVAYYDNDKQLLLVKKQVGDSTLVAQSVAQELAYAQLSVNSKSYSRNDLSFKAVCIAYMICKKYGIDTNRFPIDCIPQKLKNAGPKQIKSELSKIRNTMSELHNRISEELYKKSKERSKDYQR